jgi:hypothetical protein
MAALRSRRAAHQIKPLLDRENPEHDVQPVRQTGEGQSQVSRNPALAPAEHIRRGDGNELIEVFGIARAEILPRLPYSIETCRIMVVRNGLNGRIAIFHCNRIVPDKFFTCITNAKPASYRSRRQWITASNPARSLAANLRKSVPETKGRQPLSL